MTTRVEVARFNSLTEAQIAAGFLRSHDIDAEVLDAHHGSVAPFLIFALGWFRVTAPEAQADAAAALLAGVASEQPAAPEPARSPADRLMQLATATAGFLTGVPFVRKRWRSP